MKTGREILYGACAAAWRMENFRFLKVIGVKNKNWKDHKCFHIYVDNLIVIVLYTVEFLNLGKKEN